MNPLAGAYAQRILLTIFLASFGIYLLIATVTYTPFDPGWTHVSSDTQQVTNASGVAGAWIADFMYGFLGHAAMLLPLLIMAEAVQLWWPNSFLNRPFRFAAEVFLLMIVATLFSLHMLQPADTMANAAGGIIGFEIGRSLFALAGMWLSSIFLLILLILMATFVFGIRWHKTMDAIGKIPLALQELFYRNVPEQEAAADLTLAEHTPVHTPAEPLAPLAATPEEEAQPQQVVAEPAAVPVAQSQPAVSNTPVAEEVIHAGQRWCAHQETPVPVAQQSHEDLVAATTALLAKTEFSAHTPSTHADQSFSQQAEQPVHASEQALDRSSVRIAPSFAWQDQSLFDELLSSVPDKVQTPVVSAVAASVTPPVSSAQTIPSVTPNEVPLDGLVTQAPPVLQQPAVVQQPVPPLPETTLPVLHSQFDVADDLDASIDLIPVQPVSPPVLNTVTQPATGEYVDGFMQDSVAEDSAWFDSRDIAQAPVHIQHTVPVDADIDALISEFATPEVDFPETAKAFDDDFDVPLTDASGRPMSRSMQVVQHRAHLSTLPGLDLLDLPDPNRKVSYTTEQLERLSKLLEIKLQEFNVKASVVEAQPGPVVTRFELELAPGVKASKVTNISRDLARSMSMASVRVVEVIPGKPYIGIEVPNTTREMVRLIELLQTDEYRDPRGMISMAMGKDIAGRPVLTDLAKAPHMLVAGTTGSGKSVAVNAMLLSMLLKYTPQQLRLILIDPKQLELANYNDIPHLLTPVVTDMKDAVSALNWSVNEMERRYKLMTFLKVRKIDEFNRKVNEAIERGEDLLDPLWKPNDSAVQDRAPRLQPLPLIVIVADEFADMIMQVGKKAEELITRLAQKSRAAGIHLMLATQRPSVDVITGLIKANIPTRVALRVNSKIDSRTILDGGGAEDLLGHGDMLFLAPGKIEPERVHGAFISDDEVNRICDAWRERGSPDYIDDILDAFDEDGGSSKSFESDGGGDSERDPMYDQAVQFVLETRKASASALQRKFSLGYNRAARLIDQMEDSGIISPMGPSGKRDILV